jgi:hypothetical protein
MSDEKFTNRLNELVILGFKYDRTGLSNGKYTLLFHQIYGASDMNWSHFINIIKRSQSC